MSHYRNFFAENHTRKFKAHDKFTLVKMGKDPNIDSL